MTVMKAVAQGIVFASLAFSSARGGSMLTLGVTSNSGYVPSSSVNLATYSSYTAPSYSGSALTLGVISQTGSSGFNLATTPTPASTSYFSPAPVQTAPTYSAPAASAPSAPVYDAYINMGSSNFPNAGTLTTGNPQAWYSSPAVDKLFGGVPTAAQQASFDSTVLQRVQQTFSLSGVPVTLTDNPNDQAAHTLSVVSQTTNPTLSNAIGMTYIGGNGFHFIDNSANVAQSVDQLEWIVAHNISHELMLAFNVPENYDQSGNYIDARNASFSMMTNPNSTFSQAAANALLSQNFLNNNSTALNQGAQVLGAEAVPEPTTVVLWMTIAGLGLVVQRTRNRSVIAQN